MSYKQEPPNAVQVELTEGCNLRCPFCGLNGIRSERADYKFMGRDTAAHLAELMAYAKWNPRIEFAMHGEPSLHPDAAGIIGAFRQALPRASIMMTSNGAGLLRKPGPEHNVEALFNSGLNVLALDDYQHAHIVPKIRAALHTVAVAHSTYEYPEQPEGNPHARRKPNRRELVYIAAIDMAQAGTHASLNNHCGAAAPPNDNAQGKRCAKPFRELAVRWDGNVAVCCNDWRGVMKVGNVNDVAHIDEIWQSPVLQAARRLLYAGSRTEGPCAGCDALSYRPGLLPDRMGKVKMPPPTLADRHIVRKACGGSPYTLPVLRPWE